MQFVEAKNLTRVPQRGIRLIVLHSAEDPEKPDSAIAVAKWFAGPSAPKASSHYVVDNCATVQCVQEHDVAWGAPGANRDGIHIEHIGYARQSFVDWHDSYSLAELTLSAELAAEIAGRWAIPLRFLSVAEVKSKVVMGFCTHADVTMAFGLSDHTDPGRNFPKDDYMALVHDAFGEL